MDSPPSLSGCPAKYPGQAVRALTRKTVHQGHSPDLRPGKTPCSVCRASGVWQGWQASRPVPPFLMREARMRVFGTGRNQPARGLSDRTGNAQWQTAARQALSGRSLSDRACQPCSLAVRTGGRTGAVPFRASTSFRPVPSQVPAGPAPYFFAG